MRQPVMSLALLATLLVSLWGLQRMITQHSPELTQNVMIVLILGFLAVGAFFALLSQWLFGRWLGHDHWVVLRHGAWAGMMAVTLPILRWMDILQPLVVVAVLVIIMGVESLLLLRSDTLNQRRSG